MYSYLVETRLLPENSYDFYTYVGNRPTTVNFRGKEILITEGMRFGVRPSTNGKHIRLIFSQDPNRVITLDLETANKLARNVAVPKKARS